MQNLAASAAGLGFAALQSSTLLRIRAWLCDHLQLSSVALQSSALLHFTAQLCCIAQLSFAALHSMVRLEACKAESCMILLAEHLQSLTVFANMTIDANDHTCGNPDLPLAADCVMLKHWWTCLSQTFALCFLPLAPCNPRLQ